VTGGAAGLVLLGLRLVDVDGGPVHDGYQPAVPGPSLKGRPSFTSPGYAS
jgi:hypothetical protein